MESGQGLGSIGPFVSGLIAKSSTSDTLLIVKWLDLSSKSDVDSVLLLLGFM